MSTRQVIITIGIDIDERDIADDLNEPNPTDDQIIAAIERDIARSMEDMLPYGYSSAYDRDRLIDGVRVELAQPWRQPEPADDPPEYLGPTPPPRAHACDEDCHPFLHGEEDEHQECSVCGVSHGDPCPECDGRGYHDPDCSEVIERAEPIDRDDERAAAADARYDSDRDDRLTDPERYQ